jgi:D-alanine-D-alanine ligase
MPAAAPAPGRPIRSAAPISTRAPRKSKAKWFLDPARNKTIEIVVAPQLGAVGSHRRNVAIEMDEARIFDILSAHFRTVTITRISTRKELDAMAARRPDLVFSGVKWFRFNDVDLWLNDFLDLHGIAYMASNRAALDNEHDKARAKRIIQEADIPTAGFFTTSPFAHPTPASLPLPFPLFLKPVTGGDSRGIDAGSVVHDHASFQRKVLNIHDSQRCATLAETFLSGPEYSVGILEDAVSGTLRAMPIEIVAAPNENGHRILDYEMKMQDAETVLPVTDKAIRARLSEVAMAAFRVLGGRSLGRIDIMMNSENVPHFMEANLMPGLREGYFYRACNLNLNMSYEDMILTIVNNGLSA